MPTLPYLVRAPGSPAVVAMHVPDPWEGPATALPPNVEVVYAPLLVHSASGEIAHAWAGWRSEEDGQGGRILYRAATERWGQP